MLPSPILCPMEQWVVQLSMHLDGVPTSHRAERRGTDSRRRNLVSEKKASNKARFAT